MTYVSRPRIARACLLVSAISGSLFAYSAAFAQSTATTTAEQIVVTGKHNASIGGVVAQQVAPKTRAVVSQAYISTRPAGANALSDLNLIPGVRLTNDDPYGESGSGGHFSIRGIKGANVAEMVDGVPLNDAGNYAIYPGELVDPETIDTVSVITGSSDVDSPTSSSLGGVVDINTLTPTKDFNGFINASVGSFDYQRYAGLVNTGEIGPFGTRAWIEGSTQDYNKYTGVGKDKKWETNFKIYQPVRDNGDFVSVAGFYDRQVADFYDGVNFASSGVTSGSNYHPVTTAGYNYGGLLSTPWNSDYSPIYTPPSSTSSNSSFQGVEENPTYTGNLRGQSRFTLLPNLQLTFDPSYQWVLANGEGSTNIKGTDPRLIGPGTLTTNKSNYPACYNAAGDITGLDLDGATTAGGAPVCTDTTRLLSPSNTQTDRFTINTSLLWDIADEHLIQLSYAYDHANVRQTGEYSPLTASGFPESVFGGLQGWGPDILAADGTTFEKRNRLTIAELDQFSLEYIGKFFDEHLRLDLGVRDPMYSRNLSQYCYTQPASNVYCTSYASVATANGYTVAPFHIHLNYNKALPNVGLTWQFDPSNSVFFDYTQALNAPVNDDLYSIAIIGHGTSANAVGVDNVQPESSTTYEVGYRYQTSKAKLTLDAYKLDDDNHIVQSFDQTTQDSIDQNVGTVQYYGVEGIGAYSPIQNLNLVLSFAYNHSEDMGNIPYSATYVIPTKGKQAADTPEWTVGWRGTYDINNMSFGLEGEWVDSRYVTLVNDLQVPGYVSWDAYARFGLDAVRKNTYLQLDVLNIFNAKYLGSLNVTDTNNASLPDYSYAYAYQGTPQTIQATLHVPF